MDILKDKFGRQVDYLRLSVTDRCNLRCFYCMPEHGIDFLNRKALLSYEEMLRLIGILHSRGVNKVRITGGEPFVRKDLIQFLTECRERYPDVAVSITTNGIVTGMYLDQLEDIGINKINLSLDTLDAKKFLKITRRDEFEKVWETYQELLNRNFSLKINCVVMDGINTDDIIPMARLSLEQPVSIRFIEEMPFNGSGNRHQKLAWNHARILDELKSEFGEIERLQDPKNSTAYHYKVPDAVGNVGIIAAFTRTFCGSCNRIRLTAEGVMRNCLYDNGGLNVKELLRNGSLDHEILDQIADAIKLKKKDGWEAEKAREPVTESMSSIGG